MDPAVKAEHVLGLESERAALGLGEPGPGRAIDARHDHASIEQGGRATGQRRRCAGVLDQSHRARDQRVVRGQQQILARRDSRRGVERHRAPGIDAIDIRPAATVIIGGIDRIIERHRRAVLGQDRVNLPTVSELQPGVAAERIGIEAVEHVARTAGARDELVGKHVAATPDIDPHIGRRCAVDRDVAAGHSQLPDRHRAQHGIGSGGKEVFKQVGGAAIRHAARVCAVCAGPR